MYIKEVIHALKSFDNKKSPGNDGLTKGFYEAFSIEVKEQFVNSIRQSKIIRKRVRKQYFTLEKGVRQGELVSVYLFILCLEMLATIVKNNKDITSLEILRNLIYSLCN